MPTMSSTELKHKRRLFLMNNDNFESVHKTLSFSGLTNIIIGIIIAAGGLACGVLSIISGAKLLKSRSKLLY